MTCCEGIHETNDIKQEPLLYMLQLLFLVRQDSPAPIIEPSKLPFLNLFIDEINELVCELDEKLDKEVSEEINEDIDD